MTNREVFHILTNDLGDKYIRNYDPRCAGFPCSECRHSFHNRDLSKYHRLGTCILSWLNAPHDQPLDIHIPWTPQPPEVEPNPL